MAKKNFTGGLNSLLQSTKPDKTTKEEGSEKQAKVGRPKTSTKEVKKTSEIGTKEGEIRATFIVLEDKLEKIKALAYWEREQIKDTVNKAFSELINRYEKKH